MNNKRKLDICLTPSLIDLFDLSEKKVIVIDVFRATSAICVFLHNGGHEVITLPTVEETKKYKNQYNVHGNKYLVAAERNGSIVPDFDFGNSPLLYHDKNFSGFSLAITTTNGTMSISKSKNAGQGVILASFLNIQAVCDYICSNKGDILIVCSGWKGRVCIEDMLLAGLISNKLLSHNAFCAESDSVLLSKNIYELSQSDLFNFLSNSSYRKRMGLDQDIKYCLQMDIIDIVPIWSKPTDGYGCFVSIT